MKLLLWRFTMDNNPADVNAAAPSDAEAQRAWLQDQTTNDTLWRMEETLHSVARGVQALVKMLSTQPREEDDAPGENIPAEAPPLVSLPRLGLALGELHIPPHACQIPLTSPPVPQPPTHAPDPAQQAELEQAKQENTALSADLESARNELQEAYAELASVRQSEAKLRGIVLAKVGTQRTSDVEVKDMFVSLRQKAQAVASSQAYDFMGGPRRARGSFSKEMVKFYEAKDWGRLTPKDRKNRVMSGVFHILHANILGVAIFSPRTQAHAVPPEDREALHVGSLLRRFEAILEYNNGG